MRQNRLLQAVNYWSSGLFDWKLFLDSHCALGMQKEADIKRREAACPYNLYYCSTSSCSRGGHVPRVSITYCVQSPNKYHEVHKYDRIAMYLTYPITQSLDNRCFDRQYRRKYHIECAKNCLISSFLWAYFHELRD